MDKSSNSRHLNRIKACVAAGAVLAAFLAQAGLNRRFLAFEEQGRARQATLGADPENSSRWDPALYRVITFGNLASGVDWLWLRVLLDDRISHVPKGRHPAIFPDLDLMTDLDPAYFEVYVTGANLLAVIRDDGPGARELLLKADRFRRLGLADYPASVREAYWAAEWRIPLLLSYVELFELDDLPAAADAVEEAAHLPGAPAYLAAFQRQLKEPGGPYAVGLRLLGLLIDGSKTETARAELIRKRDSLEVQRFVDSRNRAFAAFRARSPASHPDLGREWAEFVKAEGERDPWGGRLTPGPDGRVVTTTVHERVFNLD